VALGFFFAPASFTAQQYDECIRQLEKAGAGKPAGRLYHACFGAGSKLQVFDVWESQATFDHFGQTLMPILQKLGVDPGQPQVAPIHNIIKG
jgi:hypothetical protein